MHGVGKMGAAQHHCPLTSGVWQKTWHVPREICLKGAGSSSTALSCLLALLTLIKHVVSSHVGEGHMARN